MARSLSNILEFLGLIIFLLFKEHIYINVNIKQYQPDIILVLYMFLHP